MKKRFNPVVIIGIDKYIIEDRLPNIGEIYVFCNDIEPHYYIMCINALNVNVSNMRDGIIRRPVIMIIPI